jgi:thiamine monophosphate synthase
MTKPQITEADLKRAREIHDASWPFQGKGGTQPDNIARAIAQGIAEGRAQGLEMVKKGQT